MPRSKRPANYRDPAPGPFGWEWGGLQSRQKLAIEIAAYERSPGACLVGDAKPSTAISPAVEKAIRSQFKFDEGWSFQTLGRLVFGVDLILRQLVGNCVGASHCFLLAYRIAHEILAEGQLEEPLGAGNLAMPFVPYSYGVGRDAAGIRGRGDGSTCQGQIDGTTRYGFLPCFVPGLEAYRGSGDADFPQGTAAANRLFGSSLSECRKWSEYAKTFRLVETPRIKTADEARECIVDRKIPIQACSDVGFKHVSDSKYGDLYRISGSWAHSMQVVACFSFKGQWFFVIGNQWGFESHTGNEQMGVPGGSMVVAFEEFDRYIRRCHAVGIGEIHGLASTLSW